MLNLRLTELASAALAQGFKVFSRKDSKRPAGFFYACKDLEGSFVTVNVPSHNWDDLDIAAPVKPNRKFGSAVLVDHNGTIPSMLEAMEATCANPSVMSRFVPNPQAVPNYGRKCLDTWPGGSEMFVSLERDV